MLAHPGHELRVLGWAKRLRPMVAMLTDGSTNQSPSRIPLSLEVMATLGCPTLDAHDGLRDADVFAALLAGETGLFLEIAERLADCLDAHAIDRVVSDSVEGFNPTHDLCAPLVARAVRLCGAKTSRTIAHYTFPLINPVDMVPRSADDILVELDDAELAGKLDLARRYAVRAGGALVDEVDQIVAHLGVAGLAKEVLAIADLDRDFSRFQGAEPYYESRGKKQVEAGIYQHAISYRQHVLPILEALRA